MPSPTAFQPRRASLHLANLKKEKTNMQGLKSGLGRQEHRLLFNVFVYFIFIRLHVCMRTLMLLTSQKVRRCQVP